MKTLHIFLAECIALPYQDHAENTVWSIEDRNYIKSHLSFAVELRNMQNAHTQKNLDTEKHLKEDFMTLLNSDIVLVNTKTPSDINTGSELLLAKLYKIPVFVICPKESAYRKQLSRDQEWIDPFIYELSDKIFESLPQAISYINKLHELGKLQTQRKIDVLDFLDRLYGFDAGYDEGYMNVEKFWGDKPAGLVQLAAKLLKDRKIDNALCLDLGCGHGKNSIFLAQNGFNVTAIDASYYSIKEAKSLNKTINWKVRDIRKIKCNKEKYDLIILTGSLHCLSTLDEVMEVVETVKLSTKTGGYNVLSAFNSDIQDLSGHSSDFNPLLLKHEDYVNMYSDWNILENSNRILNDEHPHNHIAHKHSITRLLVQKYG